VTRFAERIPTSGHTSQRMRQDLTRKRQRPDRRSTFSPIWLSPAGQNQTVLARPEDRFPGPGTRGFRGVVSGGVLARRSAVRSRLVLEPGSPRDHDPWHSHAAAGPRRRVSKSHRPTTQHLRAAICRAADLGARRGAASTYDLLACGALLRHAGKGRYCAVARIGEEPTEHRLERGIAAEFTC
jgi:hypothetical protein